VKSDRKEDKLIVKLKTDKLQKLNATQKKQTSQNTAEQNYPGSVASLLRHSARRRGGLILQSYRAHTAPHNNATTQFSTHHFNSLLNKLEYKFIHADFHTVIIIQSLL